MKKSIFLIAFVFSAIASFAQSKDSLIVNWPTNDYNWKVGSYQQDQTLSMTEYIPDNETIDSWTILGTVMAVKGVTNVSLDTALSLMYEQTKKDAIDPVLTMIERNDTAKNAWIMFKVEDSGFKDGSTAESQVYYIVQGPVSLYIGLVALKAKTLPQDFVDKWVKIFKTSTFITQ